MIMSLYNDILKDLRKTDMLDLKEYRKLSRKEIDSLGDDIRYWCTYGDGKLEKIGKEKKDKWIHLRADSEIALSPEAC